MRIIGGTYRGKKLITPVDDLIRPTTDRMRETLFNMLEHGNGPGIRGSKILDLFAGTGALGIEALSRGAAHVTFVDNNSRSMKLIKQNTDLIKSSENASFIVADAVKFKYPGTVYDVVFIDPPYRKNLVTPALTNLHEKGLLNTNSIAVIEYGSDEEIDFTLHFGEIKSRKMGDATFSLLEYLA
ncbi:MAG: 16S rRNA (guanine(966)-N(2))-methyltransferase RsmD [Alphaproteobacteria bacterium]|nr:16S rRNA (guanine(966)-N(2))-methyltransferase RsmD [Alphaproteobacteria bacterium]HPF45670.1 16S rRNA (guanine(966)-N(2))-methyltransferase RsmD [Emcibacteraceae bacterium]HRW28977.1 16S rRNA (guanine(966)-N(2))-methyltransferase RsmD [Emcibacteraceae bacterium]